MPRILIVDDEDAIAQGLKFNFEQEGYDVVVAGEGQSALARLQEPTDPIDLVVLDLMLPGISGYEVCTAIRSFDPVIPILILSARTLSEDKSRGFDCGTDQYMTKPFALPELISRVRNLLERRRALSAATSGDAASKPVPTAAEQAFRFGDVVVNYRTFQLQVGDRTHNLTTLEMQLLRYFIDHPHVVLSRSQILAEVWDQTADVTTRTVDNFVLRLRKLIEPDPAKPQFILSQRGTGYRFSPTQISANTDS